MTATNTDRILQHLRRRAGEAETALPDAELLERYVASHDAAAFAALVQRYGAMVLAVAQAVLRHRADAEDAFQAAFLILARKAHTIQQHEGLSGWLQSVAYRVALKARANRGRRQAREARAVPAAVAEPACDDLSWSELRARLHAELAALPQRLREPLVLCYLEGLTQNEAAQRLGWTATTLKGRLQRGRAMLRRRLERRGVALSAVLGAALTNQALAAPVSAVLVETTLRVAGSSAAAATTAATALARSLLRPPLASKLVLAAILLTAGVVAGSVGLVSQKPERAASAEAADGRAQGSLPATDLYGDVLPAGARLRLGSLRLRHAGLSDFLVLPDGKSILSAGGGVLRFWDLATGRALRAVRLQGPAGPAAAGALAPDGKTLVKLHNNTLVFWEVDSGKAIKTLPVPKWAALAGQQNLASLYFAPDSKTLIALTWKPQLILWDWKAGTARCIALPPRRIGADSTFHCCVSSDGKYLAAGGGAGELLCVYEVAAGREVYRLRCNAATSTFSPDGKRLVVSSMYNNKGVLEAVVRVFALATGKEVAQYPLGHDRSYFTLSFSPDDKTLACTFSDRSCLLDCDTGRVLRRLPGRPIVAAFSPDGKTLVANMGHRFRLWDVATGKVLQDRPGDFGSYTVMAASPDGRFLAAADWMDQSVSLWDTRSGRLLRRLPLKGEQRYVRNLSFSADGKTLVASQYKGFLQFWDSATGKERRTVQLDPGRPNRELVSFFQFQVSPDGKRLSTLERHFREKESTRLAVWDTATGNSVSQHLLPRQQSRRCAWLDGGAAVALPLKDSLTLMQVATGAVQLRIPGTAADGPLTTSPDERLVAAVSAKGAVGIWEMATGKQLAAVTTGPVSYLALTPDNRHLVTAHEKLLRVWDVATGKEQRRWPLPESITQFLLSPDGRRAFTSLEGGTALVWDLAAGLRRPAPAGEPAAAELAGWWADLAADDGGRAYAALWRLVEAPEAAVVFLRGRLRAPSAAAVKEMRRLVADLDSMRFAAREQAFERLARLGTAAEPVLQQALAKNPSLEVRRRLQLLLDQLSQRPLSGDAVRTLRALAVLEHTGANGRRLLKELAGGSEDAWLTHQARAVLSRLGP